MTGRASHGHTRGPAGSRRNSPTYLSWLAMRNRCFNENNEKYPDYGGKGITVCAAWADSFEAFLTDMGERPAGTTLDRVDGKGDYQPDNCRWATPIEQAKNRDLSNLPRKTHCPQGHAYDDANTFRARDGHAKCRACGRIAAQRRRDAKKVA